MKVHTVEKYGSPHVLPSRWAMARVNGVKSRTYCSTPGRPSIGCAMPWSM
jgi:hypothetical protein